MKTSRPLSADEVAEVRARLSIIPGVVECSVGMASNSGSVMHGFNAGTVVRLVDDIETMAVFTTHPEYLHVQEKILAPILLEESKPTAVALDYAFDHTAFMRPHAALGIGLVAGVIAGAIAGRLSATSQPAAE